MALQFPNVPQVNAGDVITSAHWNTLASAFNSRIKSGVGDPSFRIHWYIHSLFRNLRNPADANTFPAEDEWQTFYSHVTPASNSDYPVTDAGTASGANVQNPINAFVFGNESAGVYNEPDRLNWDPILDTGIKLHNPGAPSTDAEKWEVGKAQRGETDPTGFLTSQANALYAAQHHLFFRFGGFYHKGYGGFLPQGGVNGVCASDEFLTDKDIKFQKLSDSSTCIYSSCPDGGGSGSCPNTSKGVYGWGKGGKHYILQHFDNTVTLLPFEDYIEGPFNGATDDAFLQRTDGDQLSRAVNFYINDFKGNTYERGLDSYFVEDTAFDFQKFFSTQYYLAPAYGTETSPGSGVYAHDYKQYDFLSSTNAGYGVIDPGGSPATSYSTHTGFVCSGFIAIGDSLTQSKTFTIEVDGVDKGSVTVDGTTTSQSLFFEIPLAGSIKIKCSQSMGSTESAYCEILEQLEMKPSNEDAYAVLRMGSTNTTGYDGRGENTQEPKNISDAYFRHGAIINQNQGSARDELAHINRNPVYETIRKVVHDRTRVIERNQFSGYALENGKSVLYFTQNSRGDSDAYAWEGIAPSQHIIQSGEIRHNVEYIVESGTTGISYDGNSYGVGSTFTGAAGVDTYTKSAGDEIVREYDGIISTAGQNGYDNNWTMFISSATYHPNDSIYKLTAYADQLGFGLDRCVFYSQQWTDPTDANGKEMGRHVAIVPTRPLIKPESPPGYRYGLGTHTPSILSGSGTLIDQENDAACETNPSESACSGQIDHWKSCQIYTPDYEVESVVFDGSLVKVTLTGRLSHNSNAPSSISNNSGSATGWQNYVASESGPRTDENTLIDYLEFQASGTNCAQRIGDTAPDAPTVGASSWVADLYGSCIPRFYFTRQVKKAYEDGNTDYDSTDTRIESSEILWMDFILRAICEGYTDPTSTNALRSYTNPATGLIECYNKRLFDFSYENLFNAANSNRWPRIVPLSVRSDNPKMFGPLPNVYTYAEHYNQIARAVNLLYRARLYLPIRIRFRSKNYYKYQAFGGVQTNQSTLDCATGAVWADNVTGPQINIATDTPDTVGSWQESVPPDAVVASKNSRITEDAGGNCALRTFAQNWEYQIRFAEFSEYALPVDLRSLVINDGGAGFTAAEYVMRKVHSRGSATCPGWAANGNSTNQDDYKIGGQCQDWVPSTTTVQDCILTKSGTLEAPHIDGADHVDTWLPSSYGINVYGEGWDSERAISWDSVEAFVQIPLV